MQAFKHMHAALAAEYRKQRTKILAPSTAEMARQRGAEAFARHCTLVTAFEKYDELRLHPTYNSVHSRVSKTFTTKGSR